MINIKIIWILKVSIKIFNYLIIKEIISSMSCDLDVSRWLSSLLGLSLSNFVVNITVVDTEEPSKKANRVKQTLE